jgi:hypothetical protein
MLVSTNVVMVIWYTLYHGPKVLYWLIMNSPRGAKKVCRGIEAFIVGSARFVGKAFVYVHSSRRTLCLVDAALGAAVGYHYANPIIGAVVGALLGAIKYQLVSVRLLRIAPQTAR